MSDSDDIGSAGDRETLAHLERVLPPVSPPADMFDRILGEIQPEAIVIPLRSRSYRRIAAPAVGAAVAVAAAVVIAVLVLGGNSPARPDARATIAGKSDPAVTGEAKLFGPAADGGTVQVTLRDVPTAPSGHHYEVWVLRRNQGAQMEAIGSFTPTTHTVELELPLPGAGDYAAIDISIQKNGGPPEHSDTSLANGAFA